MVPRVAVDSDAAQELLATIVGDGGNSRKSGTRLSGLRGVGRGSVGLIGSGGRGRGSLRGSSKLAQSFELEIVVEALAVNETLKGIHRDAIGFDLVLGGLRFDAGEELLAEGTETDRGAIVGLVVTRRLDELVEGGNGDGLPVGSVVAGGDGEDLGFAGLRGDFGEDGVGAEGRVLKRRTDATEEIGLCVERDLVIFELSEEKLAFVWSDLGLGVRGLARVHEERNDGVLLREGGRVGR